VPTSSTIVSGVTYLEVPLCIFPEKRSRVLSMNSYRRHKRQQTVKCECQVIREFLGACLSNQVSVKEAVK
jgi:hypothetical protein